MLFAVRLCKKHGRESGVNRFVYLKFKKMRIKSVPEYYIWVCDYGWPFKAAAISHAKVLRMGFGGGIRLLTSMRFLGRNIQSEKIMKKFICPIDDMIKISLPDEFPIVKLHCQILLVK